MIRNRLRSWQLEEGPTVALRDAADMVMIVREAADVHAVVAALR